MKILIITRHYLDQNTGGPNVSKAYITALAELYNNSVLIYPEYAGRDTSMYLPLSIKKIPCYDSRSKIIKGLDIYRGRLHRFTSFVKEHLKQNTYDVIVIDHSLTAAELLNPIKNTNAKIITIHHNVEAEYVKDNMPSFLFSLPYVYYVKKAEKDSLMCSDLNLTLTNSDADYFVSKFKLSKDKVCTMGSFEMKGNKQKYDHNSIDLDKKIFVISGSMNFPQTEKALLNFLNVYFPVLQKEYPNAKLIITGRNPTNKIKQICSLYNSISLTANPDNIAEVIKKGSVYICPINTGSGIKLRVMDGLRLGLPVLAHSISAKGYESIQNSEFLFDYIDEESFLKSLKRIMSLSFKREEVYDAFQSYFGFEAGKSRLGDILSRNNLL